MEKNCTKCKVPKEATLENFPPNTKAKSGLGSWCRDCCKKCDQARHERNPERMRNAKRLEYRTIKGSLRMVYRNIAKRCSGESENPKNKSYTKWGVKNLFGSSDEFMTYVVDELKADPRGKQIHRIDNDGHYESGNIEFLTPEEHKEKHKKRRR